MSNIYAYFKHLKSDMPAGLVVFLVALPLCLGIAMASGAPLFSGIISGIIGGIVVGSLSNSHVSVSGPAAGLTAIVLTAISTLGSFELFLTAVVIAGMIQLILGFLGAGSISKKVFADGRIERADNIKDVDLYMEKIDEMIERKRKLMELE